MGIDCVVEEDCYWQFYLTDVDLLVQVELTGGYDREPVMTAENTLTLLKKQTGIG